MSRTSAESSEVLSGLGSLVGEELMGSIVFTSHWLESTRYHRSARCHWGREMARDVEGTVKRILCG